MSCYSGISVKQEISVSIIFAFYLSQTLREYIFVFLVANALMGNRTEKYLLAQFFDCQKMVENTKIR